MSLIKMDKREWFDNLKPEYQELVIGIGYDVVHSTIGLKTEDNTVNVVQELKKKYEIIIDNLNDNHNKNYEKLQNNNEFLRDVSFNKLNNKIEELKSQVITSFRPVKMGRIGEKKLYNLLVNNYPKCEVNEVCGKNGDGDILFKCNNIRFMIEYKTSNESMLRSDPQSVFEKFRDDAKKSIESDISDIGIFVAQNVESIPNYGTFEAEEFYTKKGKTYLIYIADIMNVPQRLDAAIELGIQLFLNGDCENPSDINKILDINKKLNNLTKSIRKLSINANNQLDIIEEMKTEFGDTKGEFDKSIQDLNMTTTMVDICKKLIKEHGIQKTTVVRVEEEMRKHKIPGRRLRDNGGIKHLKTLAVKELKMLK